MRISHATHPDSKVAFQSHNGHCTVCSGSSPRKCERQWTSHSSLFCETYPQLRNQNAHSYSGTLNCAWESSKIPLRSSSNGTPGKWLASPVLMLVSVGVASVSAQYERSDGGLWVDALDWWMRAGAMDDPLLTVVERTGLELLVSPRPCKKASPKSTKRADTSEWRIQSSSGVGTPSASLRAANDILAGPIVAHAASASALGR
jgi:hypothetical protein